MSTPTEQQSTDDAPDRVAELEEMLDLVMADLSAIEDQYEERISQLEATVERQQQTIDDLRQQVAELDERTDLFEAIERTDRADGEMRSATLLQHLKRKVEKERERGRTAIASVTKSDAEEALHHPDIHRTTYYSDFDRCVRWIGDRDVCYKQEKCGKTRLFLDLSEVPDNAVQAAIRNGGD